MAFGATVGAALLLATVAPQRRWAVLGADFRAFYTAGALVGAGRSDLLYDFAAQASLQSGTLPADHVSAWLLPPFAVWPFVALSRLPFPVALIAHLAVGVALVVAALRALARELGTPTTRAMAWAALAYYPTQQWLFDGQLTAIAFVLLTGSFVFLRRGRDTWAGVLLGCLAYKPQLALGLFAALVGARRARAVVAALATGAAWAAVSYATLPGATRDYLEQAPRFGSFLRASGYPTAGLHGLFQVGTLAFDALSPMAGTAVGAALTAAAVAALVALGGREPWCPGRPEWDRRMAAILALSVIASPHLFGYDLMLLLLPFFIVWHLQEGGSRDRPLDGGPLLVASALCWALALLGPVLTVVQQAVTARLFGRPFALQIGVAAIVAWIVIVAGFGNARNAKRELAVRGCGPAPSPPVR
jgi:hypothetical protein